MRNQLDPKHVDRCAVIILAAGLGKRMKSDKAKVLHEIMGKPMIQYVVETARNVAGGNVIIVVGHQAGKVKAAIAANESVSFAFQEKQLGTGHAVLCALPMLSEEIETVVILCGDVPLLQPATVQTLIADHLAFHRDLTLLAVNVETPSGYGRILLDQQMNLLRIVEEADATDAQKDIKTVNSGIYCVNKAFLSEALKRIKPNNAQGELYLTDIIEIGYTEGKSLGVMIGGSADETTGVNSREDLAAAEALMQRMLFETS